jgi:hypothetical protein
MFWNFIYYLCLVFYKIKNFLDFNCQVWNANLKVQGFKHTQMSHKFEENVFIIFNNHSLPKFSQLKIQVLILNLDIN